jgi:hypothetical protein
MANFWKYLTNKVNYIFLYIFINIDKDMVKLWKFIGKNLKIYDNELKSYIHVLNVGALSKMQIPINEKASLNLFHGFLTFQIYLNSTKSFTIEIAISDNNYGKKRILFSACSKEFIINQMHCRIPIINIPTGTWINFSIDVLSFVSECFKGQSFRAIDSICLSADCKIRRICGMRQLYTASEEEYFQGDDNILPKGFIFPMSIQYINFNLDMNYIKENVELNNIKSINTHLNMNSNMNKSKKTYPKTSQSKRDDNKLRNLLNNNHPIPDKENQKLNNDNKPVKIERKNSTNNAKLNNKTEINKKINKNGHTLKEFTESNRGSTKNIRNSNGLKMFKNEQKDTSSKLVSTMKKNEKTRKIYNVNINKTKEKYNSKSVKKVYVKNLTQDKANNSIKRNLDKNNLNENLEKTYKGKTTMNEMKPTSKNKIQSDYDINPQEKQNMNKMPQIIQINQVLINNNTNNNIVSKEDLNLFNTFNYKELESKENTLLVNQSNFNNASIPEIVDLDINNTFLKNNEIDTNINNNKNEMKFLDKNNRNEKNYIKEQEQMDSLFGEKILAEINKNNNSTERPYTPPIQKIIPVNNDINGVNNNVNISKINESIMQNHIGDIVYDNETGALFDKKTKIYYELK